MLLFFFKNTSEMGHPIFHTFPMPIPYKEIKKHFIGHKGDESGFCVR
jgi:hypothetical protein